MTASLAAYWPLFCQELDQHAGAALQAIEHLEAATEPAQSAEPMATLLRTLHSLKGMVATMELGDVATMLHVMEDSLAAAAHAGRTPAEATLLPLRDAVEWLLDGVAAQQWPAAEARAQVVRLTRLASPGADPTADAAISRPAGSSDPVPARGARERRRRDRAGDAALRIDPAILAATEQRIDAVADARWSVHQTRSTTPLAATVDALLRQSEQLRFVRIRTVTDRLPLLVRNIEERLGKAIRLDVRTAGARLDRRLAPVVADALAHLLRNAADHGIEGADLRASRGKRAGGLIQLTAAERHGRLLLRVTDDGGGIPVARIRTRLQRPDASDEECIRAIVQRGVSTAESTTEISGRGVGVDAVVATIHAVDGTVRIGTCDGQGTSVELDLPIHGRRQRVLTFTPDAPSASAAETPAPVRDDDHRLQPCVLAMSVDHVGLRDDGWWIVLTNGRRLPVRAVGGVRWIRTTGRISAPPHLVRWEAPWSMRAVARDTRDGTLCALLEHGAVDTHGAKPGWTWLTLPPEQSV